MKFAISLRKTTSAFVLALIAILPTGCGASVGTVKGKVTLDGNPLTDGIISFVAADGSIKTAQINSDGTYSASDVPTGAVQVIVKPAQGIAVSTQETVKKSGNRGPATGNELTGNSKTPIPSRYYETSTSGLSLTVKGGENKYDIVMTQ